MRRLLRLDSYRKKKSDSSKQVDPYVFPASGSPAVLSASQLLSTQQPFSASPPLLSTSPHFGPPQVKASYKPKDQIQSQRPSSSRFVDSPSREALSCPTSLSTGSHPRPLPLSFETSPQNQHPSHPDVPRNMDRQWDAAMDDRWSDNGREFERMVVAIDIGTTFSGVAYGSSRIQSGRNQQIVHWPGSQGTSKKIPTCIVYSPLGQVVAWGFEAKALGVLPAGYVKCEWFLPFLQPTAPRVGSDEREEGKTNSRLPDLPLNKTVSQVMTDYLSHLWTYVRERINKNIGSLGDLDTAWIVLNMPAALDASSCEVMRLAAMDAGLVKRSSPRDTVWRDRLKMITESEAAAIHCAALTDLYSLKVSHNFIIFDGGGRSCNSTTYKLLGEPARLKIAQVCPRSSANCGSLFLDLGFIDLIKCLLKDHPIHLNGPSIENYLHAFAETDKIIFRGEQDDETTFLFTTFNPEEPDDPAVGLINGELAIKGEVLRREVFDPIIDQVLNLIETQLSQNNTKINVLFMVGGFSESEYLFSRVERQFQSRIELIARPDDCDVATIQGAVRYGLSKLTSISNAIQPEFSYEHVEPNKNPSIG